MQAAGLGYITAPKRGEGDALLSAVARALAGRMVLCGVVQSNIDAEPDRPCHMDVSVLGTPSIIRISQSLGAGSKGCRLNPEGLEAAVGLVEATLERGTPDLLIINKFGKHEGEGRGFRSIMGRALAMGVPVLTAVSPQNMTAFQDFAQGLAAALPPEQQAIIDWCGAHVA